LYQIFIVKLDNNGNIEWDKLYGDYYKNEANSICLTEDNSFIIAGITQDYNDDYPKGWIFKINAIGDTLWSKTFCEFEGSKFNSIASTTDGGSISAGYTKADNSKDRGLIKKYIVKLKDNGDTLWTKAYGSGSRTGSLKSITPTNDDCFITAGNNADEDIEIMKLNSIGDLIWMKSFGGDWADQAYSVKQTFDSGYIIAGRYGSSSSDKAYLIKIDQNGSMVWSKIIGVDWNYANSVTQADDGGFAFAGLITKPGESIDGSDMWIVKLEEDGTGDVGIKEESEILPARCILYQNYPNPFNPTTIINYELRMTKDVNVVVFNASGEQVWEAGKRRQEAGKHAVLFNGAKFNSGVYFYSLRVDGEIILTNKMVLTK